MSEVMPRHGAEETPLINGPLQVDDDLVALREPGLGRVGVTEAIKALRFGLGENWRKEKLTDDDKRQRNLVRLIVQETIVPANEILAIITGAAEIETQEIHGIAEMTDGFVPELRKMLAGTELGVEIDAPLDSQLMRLMQVRFTEESMYSTFSMAHGALIATPRPHGLIVASEERGHEAGVIGKIIEKPVILVHSHRTGQRSDTLRYDI